MDQAAAHRANTMNWPPNVVPVFAPEVNPIERLWQHLRAALAWQPFETLEALRQKLQAVLSQMTAGAIRSLTGWLFITQPVLDLSSNWIGITIAALSAGCNPLFRGIPFEEG